MANSSFCAFCKSALEQAPPLKSITKNERHHLWIRAYPDLKAAALQGCIICEDVHRYINNPSPLSNPTQRDLLLFSEEDRQALIIDSELLWNGKSCYDRLEFVFWSKRLDANRSSHGYLIYHLFPSNMRRAFGPCVSIIDKDSHFSVCPTTDIRVMHGFEQYYPIVESWIVACVKDHTSCGTCDAAWLPTRIIDVGSINTAEEPHLVTHLNPCSTTKTPYVTLSHRWVSSDMPILTKSNIEDYKVRLPLQSLPKTFRDAIYVTRRLGVRYLWIDSLCILQDSVDDWERESALMGKIYESCACNLAASGASSGGNGLCTDLEKSIDPLNLLERKIECNWNTLTSIEGRVYYLVRESLWASGVTDSPLNARGWVLQERLLAPRTIHFGQERLFWECRQLSACSIRSGDSLSELSWPEESTEGINRGSPILKQWKQALLKANGEYSLRNGSLRKLYEPWHSIVSAYSKTSLTEDKDKLVAISGIAKSFQALLQDQYLAGLWRRTLLYDLLWVVPDNSESRRPATYRSPSWSWASIDASPNGIGGIVPPLYPHESHQIAEVISISIEPLGEDHTGQIKSASLRVRGVILPIRHPNGDVRPFHFDMTHPVLSTFSPSLDEMSVELEEETLFCLHLVVNNGPWSRRSYYLAGLILRPTNQQRNEYVRVGMFDCQLGALQDYYWLVNSACQVKNEDSQYRVVAIV